LPLVDEPAGLEQDLLEALAERLARQRIPWLELELSLSPANDLTKRLLPGESALRPDDLPLPPAHDLLAVLVPRPQDAGQATEVTDLEQAAVALHDQHGTLEARAEPVGSGTSAHQISP
jgi:hypothetical protein